MPKPVADVPGMETQLRLQFELSQKLRNIRREHGSLSFESMEPRAVVENNEVTDLTVPRHNVAEDIIEGFMVAANVAVADFLDHGQCPMLRRVVKVPKRWDRIQAIAAGLGTKLPDAPDSRALADFLDKQRAADPVHFPDLSLSIVKSLGRGEYIVELPGQKHEGHFGLAVRDYAHSTAPNRRFADLVAQRLFKSAADKIVCPYSKTELTQVAQRCTEREDAANKVERLMRKIIAASLLAKRIGEAFDGIITGASTKGIFVRLLKFPAEGMVVRGGRGADVGDKVRVKLVSVSMDKGFVDFERL
jgi:exoribonuclease R